MIATIKSEWRKNRFRPAFLVGTGVLAAITVLAYGISWYQAANPGNSEGPVNFAVLYPDQFVNTVLGAGFPLAAALAIALGAIVAGSDFGWGTIKTAFTQGPGRTTVWAGRFTVFTAWMFILTLTLFAVGAVCSVVIATAEGHVISWPAIDLVGKGFGTIWLVLVANGSLGLALGVGIRQSAAALGVGLVYLLSVEAIALRFVDSLSNGAYQWVGKLFVDQNAAALLQTVASRGPAPTIGAEQAVIVLFAYAAGLSIMAAAFLRLRDVT